MADSILIATRESRLALWQAEHVRDLLAQRFGAQVDLLGMTTRGDQILDRPLAKVGGKGLFVKELEAALEEGRADIAVHSLTKFLGGHGNSIGGIIVDSGKFPWAEHKAKFKRLNEPDVSYHGVVYTEALGPAAYIGRARVVPLRNMGAALSPMAAFQILQGIETLALRMDRICDNALAIAYFLKNHAKVAWVNYAGLPDHPDHALVQKYMGGRASGILNFGVKSADGNGQAAGGRFQDALKLVTRLVNIGDSKSLACHPASTTHRQLSPEEMKKAGVSEDMVRLSIGIEHIDDLMADLDQALQKV